MNIPAFLMTVGLPGSGKSTYVKNSASTSTSWVVVESDKYRKEKYGSESIQGDNHSLFEEIHRDIYGLLSDGQNVIFDATNLSRKHRVVLLNKIKKLEVLKMCHLFATSFENCIVQNNMRDRKVPQDVLERMRKSFSVPAYSEGWNYINIIWNYTEADYSISNLLEKMDSFQQDNRHHRLTLGGHCQNVYDYLNNQNIPKHVKLAGLFHDVGKLYTKTFKTAKGEPSEDAHYYGHENVGAYESLFYLKNLGVFEDYILEASLLIELHMRMYQLTDKSKQKIVNIVGEESFKYLEEIHKADVNAH